MSGQAPPEPSRRERPRREHGTGRALVGLVALAALATMTMLLPGWWAVIPCAVTVLATVPVLGMAPTGHRRTRAAQLVRQLVPLWWVLALAVPIQTLTTGWPTAVQLGCRLHAIALGAALFAALTPVTAMLDAVAVVLRPFARWIDPTRVGLALALTVRCLPLLVDLMTEVRQARQARGAGRSVRALAVPLVVRSLREADALGEALRARGADDT